MSVFDLYSKRKKRERGEAPDVYQYDGIPTPLRVQIVHIWRSAFGAIEFDTLGWRAFAQFHDVLCREYGVFDLTGAGARESNFDKLANFILGAQTVEEVLDVVELTFGTINKTVRKRRDEFLPAQSPDDAITELNHRFREHGIGYQFESGVIVRVDSMFVHAEVVKPALRFLAQKHFRGANQEFLGAHDHYRKGEHKACLNECLKAFESTMKSVCEKRRWSYQEKDTAKVLIETIFQKGLLPAFMQNHFTGLRSVLEGGVPTVRNKLGGHGQGVEEVLVPGYIAAYALHLTASNILFLAQAEESA